ncbi:MAG: hypothetical protein OXL96_07720 [Candidatus Poribacteria bacterium]|nr:hypothetical protein [Candidatus Poribacteria bacterium]
MVNEHLREKILNEIQEKKADVESKIESAINRFDGTDITPLNSQLETLNEIIDEYNQFSGESAYMYIPSNSRLIGIPIIFKDNFANYLYESCLQKATERPYFDGNLRDFDAKRKMARIVMNMIRRLYAK